MPRESRRSQAGFVTLGAGYNSFTDQIGHSAVIPPKPISPPSSAQTSRRTTKSANTSSSATNTEEKSVLHSKTRISFNTFNNSDSDLIEFSAGASAITAGPSISAELAGTHEENQSSDLLELTVFAYEITERKILPTDAPIDPFFLSQFSNQSDVKKIVDDLYAHAGTEVVSAITFGRAVLLRLKIVTKNSGRSTELKTKLQASIPETMNASAGLHTLSKTVNGQHVAQLSYEGWGVGFPKEYRGSTNPIEVISKLAEKFKSDTAAPLDFSLIPFYKFFPLNTKGVEDAFSQCINAFSETIARIERLKKEIQTQIQFYFQFDDSNTYEGNYTNPLHKRLALKKETLAGLIGKLDELRKRLCLITSISNIDFEQKNQEIDQVLSDFRDVMRDLPEESTCTLIKATEQVKLKTPKTLSFGRVSHRLGNFFSLPGEANRIKFIFRNCSYVPEVSTSTGNDKKPTPTPPPIQQPAPPNSSESSDAAPLPPKRKKLKLDLKLGWGYGKICRSFVRKNLLHEATPSQTDPSVLELTMSLPPGTSPENLYLASSREKPNPNNHRFSYEIYAINDQLRRGPSSAGFFASDRPDQTSVLRRPSSGDLDAMSAARSRTGALLSNSRTSTTPVSAPASAMGTSAAAAGAGTATMRRAGNG